VVQVKELQLLRVTKELQAAFKDEEGLSKAQQEVSLAQMLSNMKKTHQQRVEDYAARLRRRTAEVRARAGENDLLGQKTASATVLMEERKRMSDMRGGSAKDGGSDGGGGDTRFAKMRAVMTNRKLRDIAQGQQDEIRFLSTELTALQRRSFPSFVRAPRRPMLNYDITL
jgi:hypothetical protein